MKHNRDAYSLIELLVVISIISIIMALLLSAIQKLRESASKLSCQNNMKQVSLGLLHYNDIKSSLPTGIHGYEGKSPFPFSGWQIPILPFIEQKAIFDEAESDFKRSRMFYGDSISMAPHFGLSRVIKLYVCPSDSRIQERYYSEVQGLWVAFTSYMGSCGKSCFEPNGMLFKDSQIKLHSATDGLSNTILIGERPPGSDFQLGWWYAGTGQDGTGSADMILGCREPYVGKFYSNPPCELRPYEFVPGRFSNPCDAFHFWSPHSGGANFGFADGSVRFLRYDANPIMPALASRAGGESVIIPE